MSLTSMLNEWRVRGIEDFYNDVVRKGITVVRMEYRSIPELADIGTTHYFRLIDPSGNVEPCTTDVFVPSTYQNKEYEKIVGERPPESDNRVYEKIIQITSALPGIEINPDPELKKYTENHGRSKAHAT